MRHGRTRKIDADGRGIGIGISRNRNSTTKINQSFDVLIIFFDLQRNNFGCQSRIAPAPGFRRRVRKWEDRYDPLLISPCLNRR